MIKNTKTKLKNKQRVKVICYGDSMTWGYNDGNVQSARNYPAVLQEKMRWIYGYSGIDVYNKGVSGCTSDYGLSGFQGNIINDLPDLLIIMWGLNDVLYMELDHFISNMRQIIQLCKDNGIDVLLSTQIPIINRNPDFKTVYGVDMYDLQNQNFANAIRFLAQEQSVDLVDVYAEFNRLFCNNAIGLDFYETGGHPLNYDLVADIMLAKNLCDIYSPYRADGDVIRFDTNQVYGTASRKFVNSSALKVKRFYSLSTELPNERFKIAIYADKNNVTLDFLLFGSPAGGTIAVTNFGKTIGSLNSYSVTENPNMTQSITLDNAGLYFLELKGEYVQSSKVFSVAGLVYNPTLIVAHDTLKALSSTRGTVVAGGYIKNGKMVTVTLKLKTNVAATPLVFIVDGLPKALVDSGGLVCKNEATTEDVEVVYYDGHIANKNALPIGTYIITGSYISEA